MYHQIQDLQILPSVHTVFMCFLLIWEQTAIISPYNINWLVFITETVCVYCAVRTECLYIIQVMSFVWIWEQTAIISQYSINWLVFMTETDCLTLLIPCIFLHSIHEPTHALNKIQLNTSPVAVNAYYELHFMVLFSCLLLTAFVG